VSEAAELKSAISALPEPAFDEEQGPATEGSELSDSVLVLDRWLRRKGRELAELVGPEESELAEGEQRLETAVHADAFSLLFSRHPQMAANPADATRAEWWAEFLASPAAGGLRQYTQLDPEMSMLAAPEVLQAWVGY